MLTLLVQILGSDIAHLKDDQDTTPVFLAAQQGTTITWRNINDLRVKYGIQFNFLVKD